MWASDEGFASSDEGLGDAHGDARESVVSLAVRRVQREGEEQSDVHRREDVGVPVPGERAETVDWGIAREERLERVGPVGDAPHLWDRARW